jgi:hypothetical protein
MDDYDLDRVASDNPALTAPAAQRAPIRRLKSQDQTTTSASQSTSSQATATSVELTKYDVRAQQTGYQNPTLNESRSVGGESLGTSRRHGSL